jgi:hypothetical protein
MKELIWEIRANLTLLALRFVLGVAPENWEVPVAQASRWLSVSLLASHNPYRAARLGRKWAAKEER